MDAIACSIFEATEEHAAAWAELRHALWPECPPERHALEIRQLLAGKGLVVLATVRTALAGFAEVSIRSDHVEGTTEAPVPYLEGWFVAEEYRNRGIGRALLDYVENWARGRGFRELASDTELQNLTGMKLHAALGFREVGRSVHFVKTLILA